MKVQVETVSPIERRLSIEVDAAQVTQELNQAYSVLSRQVKVPGFRPGKVPRRILEQRYSEQVHDDVAQRVVARAYYQAIKEHKVEAVSEPQVMNNGKLTPDAPYSFTARVEVKPQVEPKDYKGLKLTKVDASVAEEKINERLAQMQNSLIEMVDVTGRDMAKSGDMCVIDFEATAEGKPFPGSKGEDVIVEVTPGELTSGNMAQLEGAKIGETKEFDYGFAADYRVEEVKGKPAHFKVTLKKIQEKKLPALDDAFAEKTGGAKTLVELKDRLRKDMERANTAKAEQDEREALIKALVEKNPFDVPQSMIDRGADMMLENAFQSMARGGIDPRQLGLDIHSLRSEFRPRADVEVRGQLLFEAIAEKEKFEVSDEDFDKKMEEIATEANASLSQVKKHYKDAEAKAGLKRRILEDKTVAFLKAAATY
ncbi:MAG: trigger factor [Myxococcaceae bacterium]|nr:trigger factor [Myxococcaceae bacterium]